MVTTGNVREGTVSYFRRDFSAPSDKQLLVNESWSLKPAEAERLLDRLVGALNRPALRLEKDACPSASLTEFRAVYR